MTRLGQRPPRYRFILNPYSDVRFSSCPECRGRTLLRKVPLAVHVDPHHPVLLNKRCRYCPDCDILIAHQDELEHMLVMSFQENNPDVVGREYLVLGTFDKSTWRRRKNEPILMGNLPEYLHAFKGYLQVEYSPAQWAPENRQMSEQEPPLAPAQDRQILVNSLIEKIERHLPLTAEIQRSTANYLQAQGISVPPHRQVQIQRVFDSSEEGGGIVCDISGPQSKEAIVISLTHLKIPYRHELEKEIRAYQKARLLSLREHRARYQGGENTSDETQ
jgi:hypothetical protein